MTRKVIARYLLFCCSMGLVLFSCAMVQHPLPDSTDVLRARIRQLWQARVEQKWDTVYDLLDTAYQQKHSKEKFISKGDLKTVLEFTILDVKPAPNSDQTSDQSGSEMPDYHAHRFLATIRFKIQKMGYTFNPVVEELWVLEKERGWVLAKGVMTGKKPF